MGACAGRSSNCWSVGQTDVDCPGFALCCFDGCANTCQGGGGEAPRQSSQNNAANSNVGQGAANNDQVQYPQQTQSQNTQVAPPRPQKKWPQKQTPIVSYPAVPNETDQSYPQGGGNRPKQQPRRQNRPKQNKPKKRPQKPRPAQRQQQARPANNNQQARPQSNNQARPQPSVMCPSAMLCVPKPNCDFKGIITDIPLNNLSPELEALRVPYLSCVNPQDPSDATTVCCRDPNYKDPWPNMNGNGGGNNRNNGNKNGNNGGYSQNNGGNGIQPRNGSG